MSSEIDNKKTELGVSVSGNAETGLTVETTSETSLQKVFGTQHPEMADALMRHCLKVLNNNETDDENPSSDERLFMVTVVAEIEPRDTVERMLAVQMAATHVALVRSARWLATSNQLEQVQAHYSGYSKLSRIYALQAETLRKHRNGGKQTVTVQHVNVEGGGQAIVGDVTHGGRGSDEK